MAEFLIYNKDHWMDVPSKDRPDSLGYDNVVRKINEKPMLTANRVKALSLHWTKYTARYRPDDIVEVRESGRPRGKLEPEAFLFIDVPELSFKNAKQYMQAHEDKTDSENPVLLHMRIYGIDTTGLSMDDTLTAAQFISRLKVKK